MIHKPNKTIRELVEKSYRERNFWAQVYYLRHNVRDHDELTLLIQDPAWSRAATMVMNERMRLLDELVDVIEEESKMDPDSRELTRDSLVIGFMWDEDGSRCVD